MLILGLDLVLEKDALTLYSVASSLMSIYSTASAWDAHANDASASGETFEWEAEHGSFMLQVLL